MANYFAVANGNFSDPNTWSSTPTGSGGFGVPGIADDVHTNNRSITIDINAACNTITNSNVNGATAGGSCTINNNITITANTFLPGNAPTNTYLLRILGSDSATVIGDIVVGAGINNHCIEHGSTGTVNYTGNIFAGIGSANSGIRLRSTGLLIAVGNFTGGGSNGQAIAIDITGGTVIATGNFYAGTASQSVRSSVVSVLTLIGNFYASAGSSAVLTSVYGATLNLTGSTFDNNNGRRAIEARRMFNNTIPQQAVRVVAIDGVSTTVTYYTVDNNVFDYAAISDVRDGVSYANGNLTGICKIPSPNNVMYNTPTDNTVGTAVLKPENVWDYLKNNIDTEGSIGERLKNAVTVNDMGKLLIDTLT